MTKLVRILLHSALGSRIQLLQQLHKSVFHTSEPDKFRSDCCSLKRVFVVNQFDNGFQTVQFTCMSIQDFRKLEFALVSLA